jgi:carboxymethylenebutenolidase
VRLSLPSGTPAELVVPDGPATRGLVVVPDIAGMRPLFDDHVARLSAQNGWAVCAFEPFPGNEHQPLEWRFEHIRDLADDRVLGDAVAAADATGCETVGILGFCMGGMYALKASGTGRFHRAVAFYGMIRVPEGWDGPNHGQPLDAVSAPGASPVMAVIAGLDRWTPAADVEALEATGTTIVRYDEADHGFAHDASRPGHRADDAADAWRRAIEFLSA